MLKTFPAIFALVLSAALPTDAKAAPDLADVEAACAAAMPLDGCIAQTDALIAAGPADADLAAALRQRGFRYHTEPGRQAEAVADYSAALKIEPWASTYYNRAQLLRFQGDEAAAQADLEQAVAMRPDYGKAWVDLSLILGNRGDYPAAIEAATNAIERDPELSERFQSMAWTNIGDASLRLGDTAQAEKALQSAVALNPQNGGAYRHLARVYVELNDKARATRALNSALAAEPGNSFNDEIAARIDAMP